MDVSLDAQRLETLIGDQILATEESGDPIDQSLNTELEAMSVIAGGEDE